MNKSFFWGILIIWSISGNSFGDESFSDFANRINEITAPVDQAMRARVACVNGNDNACIQIGEDPRDPCRAYLTTSTQQYACRSYQCQNGNQIECDKIQAYNQRMRGESARQNSLDRARNSQRSIDCSTNWQNCRRACSFSSPERRSDCNSSCDNDHNRCK